MTLKEIWRRPCSQIGPRRRQGGADAPPRYRREDDIVKESTTEACSCPEESVHESLCVGWRVSKAHQGDCRSLHASVADEREAVTVRGVYQEWEKEGGCVHSRTVLFSTERVDHVRLKGRWVIVWDSPFVQGSQVRNNSALLDAVDGSPYDTEGRCEGTGIVRVFHASLIAKRAMNLVEDLLCLLGSGVSRAVELRLLPSIHERDRHLLLPWRVNGSLVFPDGRMLLADLL